MAMMTSQYHNMEVSRIVRTRTGEVNSGNMVQALRLSRVAALAEEPPLPTALFAKTSTPRLNITITSTLQHLRHWTHYC